MTMKKKLLAAAVDLPPPGTGMEAASATNQAAAAATTPSGLDLLFAATQAESMRKAGSVAEVNPSTTTIVDNGGNTLEGGSGTDAEEASEYDAETPVLNNHHQLDSFPHILQKILATPEYQPIAHWLPHGLSFVIVDTQSFSNKILPQYFRVSLFDSFIRKLNRWGFHRVKSRFKGEESSFAHSNFVRDKPWLAQKMRCKSKPSFQKVPSSAMKKAQQAAAVAAQSIDAAAPHNIYAVPARAPHSFLSSSGLASSRTFVPNSLLTPPTAVAPDAVITPTAATIQERHFPTRVLPYHRERLFRERELLIVQLRQRIQLQMELQRRNGMSPSDDEAQANSSLQRTMMPQYTSDMMNRKMFFRREM